MRISYEEVAHTMLRWDEIQRVAAQFATQEPGAGLVTPDNPKGSVVMGVKHVMMAAAQLDENDKKAITLGYQSFQQQQRNQVELTPANINEARKAAKLN